MIHCSEFNPLDLTLERQDNSTYLLRYKGGDLIVNIGKENNQQENFDRQKNYTTVMNKIRVRISAGGFYNSYHCMLTSGELEDQNLIMVTYLVEDSGNYFFSDEKEWTIVNRVLEEDI